MTFCTKCGAKLVDDAKFCHQCGNKVFQEKTKRPSFLERKQSLATLTDVDSMSGLEFESFTGKLLKSLGYTDVQVTSSTGDQGVDVVASKGGIKYAIQCKNYSTPLNNKPIQEVTTGKAIYGCDVGVVLTNSTFNPNAVEAAKATETLLWDRNVLQNMLNGRDPIDGNVSPQLLSQTEFAPAQDSQYQQNKKHYPMNSQQQAFFTGNASLYGFSQSNRQTQRKVVFDGEIHKCPNCGELLSALTTNCPSCGYEIRGGQVTSSVKELVLALENIEIGKGDKRFRREQRINLIRNFPIPNTKEDILEFMLLASSNIDLDLYKVGNINNITSTKKTITDAWVAKFEQAYQKAQITFGTSPEFISIKQIYEDKMKALRKIKQATENITMTVGSLVFSMVLMVLLWVLYHMFGFI